MPRRWLMLLRTLTALGTLLGRFHGCRKYLHPGMGFPRRKWHRCSTRPSNGSGERFDVILPGKQASVRPQGEQDASGVAFCAATHTLHYPSPASPAIEPNLSSAGYALDWAFFTACAVQLFPRGVFTSMAFSSSAIFLRLRPEAARPATVFLILAAFLSATSA